MLIFNTKQGWKPLCDFLGVPVPVVPFPQKNARDVRSLTAFWLHVAAADILWFLMMVPVAVVYVMKTLLVRSLWWLVSSLYDAAIFVHLTLPTWTRHVDVGLIQAKSPLPGILGSLFFLGMLALVQYGSQYAYTEVYSVTDG